MKARSIVVLLLLAVVPLPAGAQAEEALLTDAPDDTELRAPLAGGMAPVPYTGEQSAAADLTALAITESDESVVFTVQVKSFEGEWTGALYQVPFSFNNANFQLELQWFKQPLDLGSGQAGWLMYEEDDRFWSYYYISPVVDVAAGTISGEVPKHFIMDGQARTPGRGSEFKDISVRAYRDADLPFNFFGSGASMRIYDEMGVDSPATFTLKKGDFVSGPLKLHADDRIRVSNGGATTFVYRVGVENKGDVGDSYDLAIENVPEGWDVRVQSPIRVEAQTTAMVPILASVPFAHDHGGFDSFNLTVQSRGSPDTAARLRLGVVHTPIPQPAGHHNELFLHAQDFDNGIFEPLDETFGGSWGYINTDEDHSLDRPDVMPMWSQDGVQHWDLWLNPSLQMGLDFDVNKMATLEGSVLGSSDGAGRLSATLWYVKWGNEGAEEILIAETDTLDLTLARDQSTPFSFTFPVMPEADYIAYDGDAGLRLDVQLSQEDALETPFFGPGRAFAPRLSTADFRMQLPLNEYHDKLSGLSDASAQLELVAEGLVEKAARPGTVATYIFQLKNTGTAEVTVDLDVAGGDAMIGEIVPDMATLAPGASRPITLGVRVPTGSADGEELEVLIFVHAVDDPTKSAVARTKTTVTSGQEAVADESSVLAAAQDAERETPGVGIVAGVAVLAAAALAMRRRV